MCLPMLGAVVGAIGSVAQGAAANSAAKANAKAMQQQAMLEREQGAYQVARQRDQLNRLTGRQVNNLAANGMAMDGSAVDVIQDSRREGELDIAATMFGANIKSNNLETQAKIVRQQGKDAMVGGIIGGFNSLISGLGKTQLGGSFA